MNSNLTTLELDVLQACWDAALAATGGDFACLDEVSVKGLGRKALGGAVTSLGEKKAISVDITYVNQGWVACSRSRMGMRYSKGTRVVQVTFPEGFRQTLAQLWKAQEARELRNVRANIRQANHKIFVRAQGGA